MSLPIIFRILSLVLVAVCCYSEVGVKDVCDRGYLESQCCGPRLYGVDWILHHMKPDYGWGDDTHRAVVILELNTYESRDRLKMKLVRHQLEIELTGVMLRNNGNIPSATDLALYVQALLAIGHDPRDFYGFNLVDDLLRVVDSFKEPPHPFLILVLCSCGAVSDSHLQKMRHYIHNVESKIGQDRELAAIALKAFACAMKNERAGWPNLKQEVKLAADALARLQRNDGSFGNVYASALIVQALKVLKNRNYDETSALDFLIDDRESRVNNILLNYYVEMAIHAEESLFLINEAIETYTSEGFYTMEFLRTMKRNHFVHYTLKVGDMPDMYHSVAIKVPKNVTFFDVMRLAAEGDSKFNFSYTLKKHSGRGQKKPDVYKISGISNDAEHGLYWRLVHETDIDHNRHSSRMQEQVVSPHDVVPVASTHYIYWYCDIFKELSGIVAGSQYRSYTYTGLS